MSLARRHFNALTADFAQTRRTLVLTVVTPTALQAFDRLTESVADQLASAAGTFDKARFLAEVRGEHAIRKVTFKEPSNV